MVKTNGELVKEALVSLESPATAQDVVNYIADAHKLEKEEIRNPVKDTLKVGLSFGFIQKKGNKFSLQDDAKIMTAEMSVASRGRSRSKSKVRRGQSSSKSNTQSEGQTVVNTPTRKMRNGARKSRSRKIKGSIKEKKLLKDNSLSNFFSLINPLIFV